MLEESERPEGRLKIARAHGELRKGWKEADDGTGNGNQQPTAQPFHN